MRLWILCVLNFVEAILTSFNLVMEGLAQNINGVAAVLLALLGLFEVGKRLWNYVKGLRKKE